MTDLATRLEQGTAEQQRELLAEAFTAVFPEPPARWKGWSRDRIDQQYDADKTEFTAWLDWNKACARFDRFITAEAYESAALMLVGEGWTLTHLAGPFNDKPCLCSLGGGEPVGFCEGSAATPALAIAAAALRAKETYRG